MGERIVVSGDGGVRVYACPPGRLLTACGLDGARAICAAQDCLFVASDRDNAIWRLDKNTLMPTGIFAGGPGISQMMPSGDGKRLYALCSDADSLLMIGVESGMPLVVNRVGVNPCTMAMDERGDTIAVAGGACGEVLLLSALSLSVIGRMATCGVVFSVAMAADCVYALSLTETMDAVLTAFLPGGVRHELPLNGMPGALSVLPDGIAAATHQSVTFASRDGRRVFGRLQVPGRAGRLWALPGCMMMIDTWSDSLFWRPEALPRWERVADGVRDAVCL